MAFSKDVERLARSLHRQRLDREYIIHYLIETFQLEQKAVEDMLERLGIPKKAPLHKVEPAKKKEEERKPPRQGFY
jgi:hypothetical protein